MKFQKKSASINHKIWRYLIVFSVIILALLWLFQVFFINQYYEWFKTSEIKSAAKEIIKNYNPDEFSSLLDSISYNNNMCIELRTSLGGTYTTDINNRACVNVGTSAFNYKSDFISSNKNHKTYKVVNQKYGNETLIYALKLDDTTYAFMSASLVPISSTTDILQNQLTIVTILVLLLAWVTAYFMSKKISKPIEQLTKSAKELSNGNYQVTFETNENITEIDELKQTLNQAKDELAKTDELRRDLMANVSHDLKTPLTMIKAYAEMVRDITYKDKEKREENLNVIIDETDRLNLLVSDILTLSSVESNVGNLKMEEFDLTELINTIIKRFQILEITESYHFIWKQKKPILVHADKQKIEQVIYNLMTNAINYTGDDNKIYIDVEEQENGIKVSVRDTGKGIKESDLKHIWDKYYKSEKKHKRNMVGTGLGLSIVKNILKAHHFEYGVSSIQNKGTTFYFIITNQTKKESEK